MPAQTKIILSANEKKQLERNIKSRKTSRRLIERSNMILLAADKVPNYKIAKKLKLDVNTVGRWRNRFKEKRLPGIEKDLPRGANHGGNMD